MVNRTIRLVVGCTAAVVLAGAVGCDKGGGGGGSREIDPQAIVGTWLEVREPPAERGGRRRAVAVEWESKNIRRITFNDDNTFKLIVCKPSGAPLDSAGTLAGTWELQGSQLTFKVTSNKLTGKYKDWVPIAFVGPYEERGVTRCAITHENGEEGTYELQQ